MHPNRIKHGIAIATQQQVKLIIIVLFDKSVHINTFEVSKVMADKFI